MNPKIDISVPKQIEVDDSSSKNIIIAVLFLIIIIFTSLGTFANEFINNVLYSTGWFIGKTSDITFNAASGSLMLANDAINSGSDLMIKASGKDGVNNTSNKYADEPVPDTTTNPIQKPITASKSNWCLVGEYQGRRGCIEIGENDKCMSGQIFPSQYTCLNPNFSQNVLPNMTTPMGVPPRMELNQLPFSPTFAQQQYVQSQISSPTSLYNQQVVDTVATNQINQQDYRQGVVSNAQDNAALRQDYRQEVVSNAQDNAAARQEYRQGVVSNAQDNAAARQYY